MFRSQVIKCYELPYCTLEILTPDRFRLLIESLDQDSEPTFQLSSDRAQLIPLAQTLKEYQQSLAPPRHQSQEKQAIYPVHFVIKDQSYSPQLTWGQLSDVVKILEQYQTDLQNNPHFNPKTRKYLLSLPLLILAVVMTTLKLASPPSTTTVKPSPSSDRKSVV